MNRALYNSQRIQSNSNLYVVLADMAVMLDFILTLSGLDATSRKTKLPLYKRAIHSQLRFIFKQKFPTTGSY